MLDSCRDTTATEAAPLGEKKAVAGKGRGRLANSAYRTRKHLEPSEVEAIANAARDNRDGARDWLMIVMCYRHGCGWASCASCGGLMCTSRRQPSPCGA
jgi:hypothetical protein